jgi:hypothetical protein
MSDCVANRRPSSTSVLQYVWKTILATSSVVDELYKADQGLVYLLRMIQAELPEYSFALPVYGSSKVETRRIKSTTRHDLTGNE